MRLKRQDLKRNFGNAGASTGLEYIDMYSQAGDSMDGPAGIRRTALFGVRDQGVQTRGDPVYANASQAELRKNVRRAIQRQNQQLLDAHYARAPQLLGGGDTDRMDGDTASPFEALSPSASRRLKLKIRKFYAGRIFLANFRPFSKSWVYDASVSARGFVYPAAPGVAQAPSPAICFANASEKAEAAVFMVSGLSSSDFFSRGRLLPLRACYAVSDYAPGDMTAPDGDGQEHYGMVDGITDLALAQFRAHYACPDMRKDEVFYYVYGVLHSEDCGTRYAKDLRRDPPRIPVVRSLSDFRTFCDAGRALAHLHLNYDAIAEYPLNIRMKEAPRHMSQADYWRVDQMKFGTRGDRTKMVYNDWIGISGIPLESYDYLINGRPAVVWAMESQGVKKHASTGLVNDANLWATEVMGDPAYPLKLIQRVITCALETRKIIQALPFLE